MADGEPTCIQETFSTCLVVGGSHYKTFDGKIFDFMGTCAYVLSKSCDPAFDLPYFSIEVKNGLRGNIKSPYVDAVTVQAYNVTVAVVRSEKGLVRVREGGNNGDVKLCCGLMSVS